METKHDNYTKTYYYTNGSIRSEMSFRDGQLYGPCRGWHKDGKLRFEGSCNEKGKHGLWSNFDFKGNATYEYWAQGKQLVLITERDNLLEDFKVNFNQNKLHTSTIHILEI